MASAARTSGLFVLPAVLPATVVPSSSSPPPPAPVIRDRLLESLSVRGSKPPEAVGAAAAAVSGAGTAAVDEGSAILLSEQRGMEEGLLVTSFEGEHKPLLRCDSRPKVWRSRTGRRKWVLRRLNPSSSHYRLSASTFQPRLLLSVTIYCKTSLLTNANRLGQVV